MKERVRKSLLRFGRKNRICGILVLPALFVSMFFFHVCAYVRGNCKRYAMGLMVLSLLVVYSSFSFPLFISGSNESGNVFEDTGEEELLLTSSDSPWFGENLQLLTDEDVLEEEELESNSNPHGMDMLVSYDAADILASMENHGQSEENASEQHVEMESVQNENAQPVFDANDWKLVLINKQHSIPEDYELKLGTIAGSMQCDERIVDELLAMLKAAGEDGVSLTVCSPYRSSDRQVMLFERKITRYMKLGMSYMEAYQLASQAVTVPGNSEHEVGLAFDIVGDGYTSLNAGFGKTTAGKWLAENSKKYGFILRYPKGKEYVTGIEYEPWHFRYVGKDAATLIMDQGITLEEFWEGL